MSVSVCVCECSAVPSLLLHIPCCSGSTPVLGEQVTAYCSFAIAQKQPSNIVDKNPQLALSQRSTNWLPTTPLA